MELDQSYPASTRAASLLWALGGEPIRKAAVMLLALRGLPGVLWVEVDPTVDTFTVPTQGVQLQSDSNNPAQVFDQDSEAVATRPLTKQGA